MLCYPKHVQCRKWGLVLPAVSMVANRMYPRKKIHKPSGTSKAQKDAISGCASRWLPNGRKIYCLVKIFNRWAAHLCSFAKLLIFKSLTLVPISSSSTEFSRNTPHLKAASELTSWESETCFVCISCISYRMKVTCQSYGEHIGRIFSPILNVEQGLQRWENWGYVPRELASKGKSVTRMEERE